MPWTHPQRHRTERLLRQVQIVSARIAPELEQRVVAVLGGHLILLAAPQVEVVDGDGGAGVAVRVQQVLQTGHQRRLATPLGSGNTDLGGQEMGRGGAVVMQSAAVVIAGRAREGGQRTTRAGGSPAPACCFWCASSWRRTQRYVGR